MPSTSSPRAGLLRRLAAVSTRGAAPYEAAVAHRKQRLLAPLRGRIVELGPGAGANLPYLDWNGRAWFGVEPSGPMQRELRARATLGPRDVLLTGTAEALPVDDGFADAVVSTLVLCSVDDVGRALAEVRRVLKPGGVFVFIEHVAAPSGTHLRCAQSLLRPLWRLLGDGCRPNQDTTALIRAAGFARLTLEHFCAPAGLLSPHIAGIAVR